MNLDFDASNSNAVAAAMIWIEATMLGGIATIAAVIAVATFELLLFLGRSAGPAADRSRASELLSFSARRRLHRESCAASMVRQKILRWSRAWLLRYDPNTEPAVPATALGARPSTAFERALSPSLRVAICRKRISFRHEASALPFELLELL